MQNFDGEIKIKSWIKRIKINEKGEYLEFNLADSQLLSTIISFTQKAQEETMKIEKEIKECKDELENIRKASEHDIKFAKKTDELFGENTCIKVFNTSTPCTSDIMEFLNQIADILMPYIEERQKHIETIGKTYIDKANKRRDGK